MPFDGHPRRHHGLLRPRIRARTGAHGAAGIAAVAVALSVLTAPAGALAHPVVTLPVLTAANAGATPVRARVLDSGLEISLDLDGYSKDEKKPSVEYGQVILAGTLDTGKKSVASTSIALIADRNEPRMTSDELCKERGSDGKGNLQNSVRYFEVGDIACYEQLLSMTGAGISGSMVFFHAFALVGDHWVEIRVSSATFDNKDQVWPHDRFVKLVKTLKTGPSRAPDLAGDNDLPALALPPELDAFRKQAAAQGKAAPGWIGEQCAAHPDDWVSQFVLGEYGDRAGLARACELLGAKTEPALKERNALFLAERVLGSRLLADGVVQDAVTHLGLALEIATVAKLQREVRPPLVYDLARCHARSGKADEALELLKEALKLDPSRRDAARKDDAFESLKENKTFKSLVRS